MKALTITQPWATLIALRVKTIETRSWSTGYRGQLAIHAAKGFPAEARNFALTTRFLPRTTKLPLGAVIATARLVECERVEAIEGMSEANQALGNFRPGRFAWILADVEALDRPIVVRGALGLWEWAKP